MFVAIDDALKASSIRLLGPDANGLTVRHLRQVPLYIKCYIERYSDFSQLKA
jgi:hypothetical protein